MFTATGPIFKGKVNIYSEFVYQYGTQTEWSNNTDWNDKTSVFMATAGFMRIWKTPNITLLGQYYYDSNDSDFNHKYMTAGHNAALALSFGRLFGSTDFTLTLFGLVNFGKYELTIFDLAMQGGSFSLLQLADSGVDTNTIVEIPCAIFSALFNYSPIKEITLGLGPYITFSAWDKAPVVNLKLQATLGGGKF
jgi:hypothetical protein